MKVYIGWVKIPERFWKKNGLINITPLMIKIANILRCDVICKGSIVVDADKVIWK